MPSFTADYFGAKHMGGIYGWILLAWGVGGVVSPTHDRSHPPGYRLLLDANSHYCGRHGGVADLTAHHTEAQGKR